MVLLRRELHGGDVRQEFRLEFRVNGHCGLGLHRTRIDGFPATRHHEMKVGTGGEAGLSDQPHDFVLLDRSSLGDARGNL